jgi:hypothetical protein
MVSPINILTQPFNELGTGPSFCEQSATMGIFNLSDVIALTLADILVRQGFTYSWLSELT